MQEHSLQYGQVHLKVVIWCIDSNCVLLNFFCKTEMRYCLQFWHLISQLPPQKLLLVHACCRSVTLCKRDLGNTLSDGPGQQNVIPNWCPESALWCCSHFCHNTWAGVQASTEVASEGKYNAILECHYSAVSQPSVILFTRTTSLPLKHNSCLETGFGLLPVPLACNPSHDIPMKSNQRFTIILAELPSFLSSEYNWEMCMWNNTDPNLLLIIQ